MNTQLERAVIDQLGLSYTDVNELRETLQDIRDHGIDSGFGGFVYYSDTVKFAEDNKSEILNVARDMADDFGLDGAYSLIAGFLQQEAARQAQEQFKQALNDITADSVAEAIHSPDSEDYTYVMNSLSWFAAEEVARSYDYE